MRGILRRLRSHSISRYQIYSFESNLPGDPIYSYWSDGHLIKKEVPPWGQKWTFPSPESMFTLQAAPPQRHTSYARDSSWIPML